MSKLLIAILSMAVLSGCASAPPKNIYQEATEKYAPWIPYSIASKSKTVYLADPYTKKQVGNGIYKIWTKNTNPDEADIITQEVVDCNSEETMTIQMVFFFDGKASKPLKLEKMTFRKQIPGTVGYGLVEYVCK